MQPAFLIALFSEEEKKDVQQNDADGSKHPIKEASLGMLNSKKSSLVDSVLLYVGRSGDLINRYGLQGPDLVCFYVPFVTDISSWSRGSS